MTEVYAPGTHVKATVRDVDVEGLLCVDGYLWSTSSHPASIRPSEQTDVRPLVVLDPDDAEQAKALFSGWNRYRYDGHHNAYEAMAHVLRDMAPKPVPVKPDEPTTIGAVVEDTDDMEWTRWTVGAFPEPWINRVGTCRAFANINAVRVLSEGVNA